jgi:hypothetical protein
MYANETMNQRLPGALAVCAHAEAMTLQEELLTTTQKALTVNLERPRYGTLAELGARQEVAQEFFNAGASGKMVVHRTFSSAGARLPAPEAR